MNKEEYIENVLKHIRNKTFTNAIRNELDAHITDRELFYRDCGYDNDTALQKAIEHMGNADNVGEQMNKLHTNTKAVIISILSLLIYIGGLIFAVIDILNFMVISTDPGEVYLYVFIASFITFASGTLCYTLSLKHRQQSLMTIFGIVNLIGMLSPFTFLAFGYSIAGFIFSFSAAVELPSASYGLIGNPIGFGTDSDLAQALILILTSLFFFVPLISAILSFSAAKELRAQQYGFFNKKRIRHFKRYGILLLTLTIIGAVTLSIETITYKTAIQAESNRIETLEIPDTVKAFEMFDAIELPLSKYDLNSVGSIEKYNESDANEYGYVLTRVYENAHYTVLLWDNDADGIYDEKRIYAAYSSDIKETDL
ncbi:MAG: hypothetical protein K2J35_03705, partial [Eubacterium sp.]|nr:hypothetical protein [Eubacterium sp.]